MQKNQKKMSKNYHFENYFFIIFIFSQEKIILLSQNFSCQADYRIDFFFGITLGLTYFICFQLYDFIFQACVNYEFEYKPLGVVFKLLFKVRERTTAGTDFYETMGLLLTREYGSINGETPQCPFLMKAITHLTVESCATNLIATLKTQFSQVNYLLQKSDAIHCLSTQFPCDSTTARTHIRHLDQTAITLMINIAKVINICGNAAMGLNTTMMTLVRMMKAFYFKMLQITQKLSAEWTRETGLDFEELNYELLLQATAPLANTISSIILYVEKESTKKGGLQSQRSKLTNEAKAQKVLRDGKLLPLLVNMQERFSKAVFNLSTKTKYDFYALLKVDASRDFRLDSSQLFRKITQSVEKMASQGTTSVDDGTIGDDELGEDDEGEVVAEERATDDEGDDDRSSKRAQVRPSRTMSKKKSVPLDDEAMDVDEDGEENDDDAAMESNDDL